MPTLNRRIEILKPGHAYRVNGANNQVIQEIRFIHKEPIAGSTKQLLRLVEDGTTTEDLIDICIDHLEHVNGQLGCEENVKAISALDDARKQLVDRTEKRIKQKVVGTFAKHDIKAEGGRQKAENAGAKKRSKAG